MEFTDNEFQGEKWKMEEMHNRWVTQGVDIDQKVDLISRAGKCVNILYSGACVLSDMTSPLSCWCIIPPVFCIYLLAGT